MQAKQITNKQKKKKILGVSPNLINPNLVDTVRKKNVCCRLEIYLFLYLNLNLPYKLSEYQQYIKIQM